MDESALKILLDNLEMSRSSLHGWLLFWTFLVVLGVALELVFVVKEYIDQSHDFRRGIIHSPEKPSTMLFVSGLLGAGLVAIGVAGELYIDVQAGKVETEIRKANELRAALLSKEASDAKTSAEGAAKAASEAKASAKVIGEQAAILEATVRRLIWQGPRDILLSDAGKSFKPLRRFSGQQFRFSVCRSDISSGGRITPFGLTEVGRTQQAVFLQLWKVGWKIAAMQGVPAGIPMPYISDDCTSMSVSAIPPKAATQKTRDAASALQSVLNRVLSDNIPVGLAGTLSPDLGPDIIDIHVGLERGSSSVAAMFCPRTFMV